MYTLYFRQYTSAQSRGFEKSDPEASNNSPSTTQNATQKSSDRNTDIQDVENGSYVRITHISDLVFYKIRFLIHYICENNYENNIIMHDYRPNMLILEGRPTYL